MVYLVLNGSLGTVNSQWYLGRGVTQKAGSGEGLQKRLQIGSINIECITRNSELTVVFGPGGLPKELGTGKACSKDYKEALI